jgi:hypothetical protein
MLPLQNIFQSISALQASTPNSLAVQANQGVSQFGSPLQLGANFQTPQQTQFGSQFGSSQLLGSNGLNTGQGQLIPSALAFGQPTSVAPQNGQIDLRNPQARQALIQQLSQVAVTIDPNAPESQQVQARIAALNNVNPDGSFNQVGQLFQQLSMLEPASPQAQSIMGQIAALQQQQRQVATPTNNAVQTPLATIEQTPFQQPQLPQAFGQPNSPAAQSFGQSFGQASGTDPMTVLMQSFMQMMGMMFALMSSR